MRFAYSLKQELTDLIKSGQNNSAAVTTKQLLIQSVKDLAKKREQFNSNFYEAIGASNWLKLSKPNEDVNNK